MSQEKKFRLEDMSGSEVMGGDMAEGNAYVSSYGKLISGKPPWKLEVGESCVKEYALSGQKPTQYRLVRVS